MNPIIGVLTEQIAQTRGAMASAVVAFDGFGERLAAGIAAALENGATAAELTELTDLEKALDTDTQALAEAVAKNPLPGEGGAGGGTQATDPNNPPTGAGNSFDGTGWINASGQPIDQQGNVVASARRR